MLGNSWVQVEVGDEKSKEAFQVHKGLLCKKVPYFNKMFNGGFLEGQTQSTHLLEDDPQTFKFFLSWLYREMLGPEVIDPLIVDPGISHANLMIFAEKYCMTDLADSVMDSFCKYLKSSNKVPSFSWMRKTCQDLPAHSKMNLFYARTMAYSFYSNVEAWPNEGLRDLMKADDDLALQFLTLIRLQKGAAFPDPSKAPPCDYHQHSKDEVCSRAKAT